MVLQQITVLDLTTLLPGPVCTQLLGDFGAEIIKIEAPPSGDRSRILGPKLRSESGAFVALNRNKKSLVLDLKRPQGKDIFLRLAERADVILETYRPGVVDKLGIGYKDIQRSNPGIVYCSLSGYGQEGPYRDKPNHDINFLALTGLLDLTGSAASPPAIPGGQIGDITGALLSVIGILLALRAREQTGKGQHVDVAMMDGVMMALSVYFGEYLGSGIPPGRGKELLNGGYACYNVYETKDHRHMALGAVESHFWEALCRTIGKEELIGQQFGDATVQSRLMTEVAGVFREKTQDEWVELLKEKKNVPCEPVRSMDKIFADPHVKFRNMITEIEHPMEGRIKQLGIPVRLSATPGKMASPAPLLGQHTKEILASIGYSEDEIQGLSKERVIGVYEDG